MIFCCCCCYVLCRLRRNSGVNFCFFRWRDWKQELFLVSSRQCDWPHKQAQTTTTTLRDIRAPNFRAHSQQQRIIPNCFAQSKSIVNKNSFGARVLEAEKEETLNLRIRHNIWILRAMRWGIIGEKQVWKKCRPAREGETNMITTHVESWWASAPPL